MSLAMGPIDASARPVAGAEPPPYLHLQIPLQLLSASIRSLLSLIISSATF